MLCMVIRTGNFGMSRVGRRLIAVPSVVNIEIGLES
jgi:hypothetical protein